MTTRDVSSEYDQWAHGGQAAAFSPDSPYGGDHLAVRSGKIDPGRAELDRAVQRQLAQTGSDDYDAGLAIVLSQCRSGVLCLSAAALSGTGVQAVRPGRGGLQHHPVTGEAITLAAAPAMPLGEPLPGPEDTALFKDTLAYCQARRPGADRNNDAATRRLIERCDDTAHRQINDWIAAGGAKVAGVRFG
jgi:hypothetical protein